ncbi:molybdenum cofactor guanylyltransferase [Candidatus Poriferisodalis sp.]|uniref:molybdenum cofactor guanylyltransferase n=1 Tax=Candidatus Poriferisodalis sp. TaxID=3101277 RepID=UPI003B018812
MSPVGVVLCGGASTRMGHDKANLELAGKPLALWVAEALAAAGAHPIIAQGGSPPPPLVVSPDSTPHGGPLPALVDALERHGDILVCPTDVPTVPAGLLAALAEHAQLTDAPVVLARSDRLEPLIGHYATAVLPTLRNGLRAGARGPRAALTGSPVPTVPTAPADVLNVNTSADLAEAEAVLASRAAHEALPP